MKLLLLSFIKDRRVWVVLVIIALLYVAYSAHASVIFDKGKLTGIVEQTAIFEEEKRIMREAYDEEIRRLNKLKVDVESKLQAKLDATNKRLETRLEEVNREAETTIANLRNRNLRLSIELRDTAANAATTELAAATASRNGARRAELSENAAEFLIGFAARADRVAERLQTCQSTINEYHEAVNEYNRKYITYEF